jgi:hypothetical protein
MPQCQFPIFCCFCVLEKLHRKYSQNWMKQKPKFLFFPKRDGVQSWDGGGHATPWREPPPGRARGRCGPWSTPWHCPSSYIFHSMRKPKRPDQFPWNILQATAIINPRSGGSRSSSRHPAREGNHHWRPSSSPCLPPEWCVSSLPWTMGP